MSKPYCRACRAGGNKMQPEPLGCRTRPPPADKVSPLFKLNPVPVHRCKIQCFTRGEFKRSRIFGSHVCATSRVGWPHWFNVCLHLRDVCLPVDAPVATALHLEIVSATGRALSLCARPARWCWASTRPAVIPLPRLPSRIGALTDVLSAATGAKLPRRHLQISAGWLRAGCAQG